jgi:hypothetical protein
MHSIFPGLFLGDTNLTMAIIDTPTPGKDIRLRLKDLLKTETLSLAKYVE